MRRELLLLYVQNCGKYEDLHFQFSHPSPISVLSKATTNPKKIMFLLLPDRKHGYYP